MDSMPRNNINREHLGKFDQRVLAGGFFGPGLLASALTWIVFAWFVGYPIADVLETTDPAWRADAISQHGGVPDFPGALIIPLGRHLVGLGFCHPTPRHAFTARTKTLEPSVESTAVNVTAKPIFDEVPRVGFDHAESAPAYFHPVLWPPFGPGSLAFGFRPSA